MLLRYGYTVNETRELDRYFYELFQSKTSVSFEDYHQKVCKFEVYLTFRKFKRKTS